MVLECENSTEVEIVVGTYEEFVLGYKLLKTEHGLNLSQSFANHSHRASVRCVAAGGRFMASGGADDVIQLYDMKLRKEMSVLMHHDKTVTCLAFIENSHLISGSDDGQIAIWRTGSWQCEKIFSAHPKGGLAAIAVHPSGKLCLTSGSDRSLKTWNLVKGRSAYVSNLHGQADALAWSPEGNFYAVLKLVRGGAEFSVDVYSVALAGVIYAIVPEQRPSSICFMQEDVVAVGLVNGNVELHAIPFKSRLCSFRAHSGRVRCLNGVKVTSSGATWLVSAASDGEIAIWKYKTWAAPTMQLSAPKKLGSVATGCRVTSLAIVVTPTGVVETKSEPVTLTSSEVTDVKLETPSVWTRREGGKVVVEMSEDELTEVAVVGKKRKNTSEVPKSSCKKLRKENKQMTPSSEVTTKKKKKKKVKETSTAKMPQTTETGSVEKKRKTKVKQMTPASELEMPNCSLSPLILAKQKYKAEKKAMKAAVKTMSKKFANVGLGGSNKAKKKKMKNSKPRKSTSSA